MRVRDFMELLLRIVASAKNSQRCAQRKLEMEQTRWAGAEGRGCCLETTTEPAGGRCSTRKSKSSVGAQLCEQRPHRSISPLHPQGLSGQQQNSLFFWPLGCSEIHGELKSPRTFRMGAEHTWKAPNCGAWSWLLWVIPVPDSCLGHFWDIPISDCSGISLFLTLLRTVLGYPCSWLLRTILGYLYSLPF